MSAAARQRRYRERQRAGLEVLSVSADLVHAAAVLIAAGYLRPDQEDDRRAIAAAVGRMLADAKPFEA